MDDHKFRAEWIGLSRLQCEMLQSLLDIAASHSEIEHIEGLRKTVMPGPYENFAALRLALHSSDLASRLGSGEDLLPDIYEAYSNPLRGIMLWFRPRSHAQLAVHMALHLQWYLDPSKAPAAGILLPGCAGLGTLIWLGLTFRWVLSYMGHSALMQWITIATIAFLMVLVFRRENLYYKLFIHHQARVNAYLLYRYLFYEWCEQKSAAWGAD